MNDLPQFTASSLTTNNTSGINLLNATGGSYTVTTDGTSHWDMREPHDARDAYKHAYAGQLLGNLYQQGSQDMAAPVAVKPKLRIVRVFLVDPDERVPVESRILHRSAELTTDATDQELFFDIPVNDLLKKHNELRATVKWEEKTAEGTRERMGLKEARIRDLVMSVTTIATF